MSNSKQAASPVNTHVHFLDGFRGALALWVYLGHLAGAVGYSNYFLNMHALAVDLFMVLSGFLMVYTWGTDLVAARILNLQTITRFYLTRFFRVAPLYYFLLVVCYLFLPQLNEMYDYTHKVIPPRWAQGMADYDPKIGWNFDSFRWLYLHVSFVFGIVPGMEASTPLPDWSLSLEMQFYLLFPVLLVVGVRWPLLALAVCAATLALLSPSVFGSYLLPGSFAHFGQPSLLLYRLNAFVAGMAVAFWLRRTKAEQSSPRVSFTIIAAALICVLPLGKPVILIYLLLVALLLNKLKPIAWVLSRRSSKVLGDISYSIYLCHLLVVIPVTYGLLHDVDFMNSSTSNRFLIALAITAPMVIAFSYLLHITVERSGIRLGKFICARGVS